MDDGGGVRAGCIRIRCPSPRRLVTRWFSPQRNVKGKKTAMAEARVGDSDAVRIRTCSENGHHGVAEFSDPTPRTIDSEEVQRREFSFSIGVVCCLLHLIATGREEIQKIVELRNNKFLECRNEELRRKQQEQSETFAFSTTSDIVYAPGSSTDHYYSPQIMETSEFVGDQGSFVFKREDLGGEMDQLEAELEAEFELLQIGQGQEGKFSKLKEVAEKGEDSEGLRFRHMWSGPVEAQQGVCPYELERRLHELMETRQEEEIKELEIALEDAKRRFHLKESEVSWWKDTTAYIVSERIPEPSRITPNSLESSLTSL